MNAYAYGKSPERLRPAVGPKPGPVARAAVVPLRLIVVHDHNVRRNLGDLRELTASIRRHGILVPLSLERYGDRYRIRDGHRRYAAAQLAGLTRVLAIVHGEPLADSDWVVEAVQVNHHRRGMSPSDRRDAVQRLRAERVSWAAIADELGVSVATARRWGAPPRRKSAKPATVANRGGDANFGWWVAARLRAANDWAPSAPREGV